ncbi:MAG: hypothetical protein LBU04_07700 [Christensenellaceae bacterium]|jgi:hypothetical protein|nr:hypothetical protein [Christensenellaceae bacterium]
MEKSIKRITILISVVLIALMLCVFIQLNYGNESVALADTDITVSATGIGNGAHANGHVYYSEYEFNISGNWESYYYNISDNEDWIRLESSRISLLQSLNGSNISFKKFQNGQPVEDSLFSYEHKLYIDAAPKITLDPPLVYSQSNYDVEFELGVSYVGYTITVTNSQGMSSVVPFGVNKFNVSDAGTYVITVISDTGAQYSITHDALIDTTSPEFIVYALKGGNNNVWATKSTYIIIPIVIPKSGVKYWWSMNDGVTKNPTGSDGMTQYAVDVAPIMNGEIVFGAQSGSGVSFEFQPTSSDASKFITCVDTEIPVLSVDIKGDSTKPTMGKIDLLITTSGNQSGTSVYYSTGTDVILECTTAQLTILQPGIYRFYAVSGAGERSNEVIKDLSFLDITPPEISILSGKPDASGSYKSNIKLLVSNFSTVKISRDGKELNPDFDDAGVFELNKSGNYFVEAFDEAGNRSELMFRISKPNIALIVTLSVLTAGGVGAIIYLVLSNMKKASSIRRLVSSSTVSDDNNKFLMFKRIRKGGKV